MKNDVFSTPLNPEEQSTLQKKLQCQGFQFSTVDYAFWQGKNSQITVTFYKSGKLVVQGTNAAQFAEQLLPAQRPVEGLKHIQNLDSWIGTDESGKGDFFGSLVVAALFVTKRQLNELVLLGVQDSKVLTDKKIADIAPKIKAAFKYEVVRIEPQDYNRIYSQFNNLNKLLAQAHAEAISKLLHNVKSKVVLTDKFADDKLLSEALQKKGHQLELVQQPRAEINPGVAGASILARAEYVNHLHTLSQQYKIDFPKGATNVIEAAKKFVSLYGIQNLNLVAKLHFKTTTKLYG